jgi:hypothetical protein
LTASVCVALAVAVPAFAQGKGGGNKKPPKAAAPPSTSALSSPSNAVSIEQASGIQPVAPASPFAWLDDASIVDPGSVWVGVSMLRWYGPGFSETIAPVVDAAVGLTPRLQLGASVPRVAGGLGTTFFGAKIAVLSDEVRNLYVAVSPTLEVMGGAVMDSVPGGPSRTQWGLPVSVHFDGEGMRIYASSGYFSPGIWFAGAGLGKSVSDRVGISGSFSQAWTTVGASDVPLAVAPRRNELSGGASYELGPNVAVFGSIGRTIGTTAENGAGTTIGFGVSITAAPGTPTR